MKAKSLSLIYLYAKLAFEQIEQLSGAQEYFQTSFDQIINGSDKNPKTKDEKETKMLPIDIYFKQNFQFYTKYVVTILLINLVVIEEYQERFEAFVALRASES